MKTLGLKTLLNLISTASITEDRHFARKLQDTVDKKIKIEIEDEDFDYMLKNYKKHIL